MPARATQILTIEITNTSWGEIRRSPSELGIVVGFAKPSEKYSVVHKNDWYLIVSGKYSGAYLATKSATELAGSATTLGTLSIKNIRVREKPSENAKIVGNLSNQNPLSLEAQGEWYKILDGPFTGFFISAKYVNSNDETAILAIQKHGFVSSQKAQATDLPQKAAAAESSPAPPTTPAVSNLESAPNSGVAPSVTAGDASAAAPPPTPPPAPTLPAKVWDSKTEKRFEDQVANAFKAKKSVTETEILMPVFYDQYENSLGQVKTYFKKSQPLLVETGTLFKFLKRIVVSDWFQKKEVSDLFTSRKLDPDFLLDSKNWVSLERFEKSGVSIIYDEAKLLIRISVPPELRKPGISSLSRYGFMSDQDQVEKPSLLSSYLNINATESFDTRQVSFDDRRTPLAAQLENGTNFAGFVLEAFGSYQENRDALNPTPPFTRQDVRIVRDFPNQIVRSTAGDLNYPITGFQSFRQMGGVSVTSQFSMSPSKLTYPSGNYEFFLQRKSKEYDLVNNGLVKALDLPAGKHLLQEFPFTAGANDVRLEILDDVGRSETLTFSYFSNTEMLKTGLAQYNYALGAPSTQVLNDRVYDNSNPTFSGFHRYGLSETTTIGANLQGDKNQILAGLDHLLSTDIGYFKTEGAVSSGSLLGIGEAAALHYIYTDYKGEDKTQRTSNLGLTYHSQSFSGLDLTTIGIRKQLEITGGYTTGISKFAAANFGLNYSFNYKNVPNISNSFTIYGGLNRRFENGISTNLTLRHTKSELGTDDISAVIFLLWSFPQQKQIVTALYSSTDSSTTVDWSYNPSSGADAYNFNAEAKSSATDQGYSGQANFNGNRARAAVSYQELLKQNPNAATATPGTPAAQSKISNEVTTLQLGTALVYAGGHFAVSRPVTDSFAIVAPYANLKGQVLPVNPDSQGNYVARTSWLGAAAAPELSSYNFTSIIVGGKELPTELTIPRDHFDIYPSYKSGYAFRVGTDATIYLTAHIQLPDKTSANSLAGRAVPLDHSDEAPIIVFTNRRGVLRSEGFKPGHYRLEIATDTYAPTDFVIPEGAKNDFDLGSIVLKLK